MSSQVDECGYGKGGSQTAPGSGGTVNTGDVRAGFLYGGQGGGYGGTYPTPGNPSTMAGGSAGYSTSGSEAPGGGGGGSGYYGGSGGEYGKGGRRWFWIC